MEHDAIIIYGGSSLIAKRINKKVISKIQEIHNFLQKKKLYRSIYK